MERIVINNELNYLFVHTYEKLHVELKYNLRDKVITRDE